ncbi:hypothetical protein GSI_07622 [Ganoderma sinense ZZ0214-1]|uniref:Fungal-type protein kinase domain-containing protein n=1 Tax=Ganoderma sinense ZZ0214-1 TaxID=1077348 RepID=A0A2G8S9K1_9APHY|nr:hypothetical protein GSI_07622 [Ganoderma sinense ZZ0214-1]
MAPHYYFINPYAFFDAISGSIPTEGDYEKFKKPDLSSKQELELHRELSAVVQSVLNATGCDLLRFWGTCGGKATHGGKKEPFADGGIYTDSSFGFENKSQAAPVELELRLRHWIDVPFWVRMSERHAAKIYFDKSESRPSLRCADPTSAADRLGGVVDSLLEGQSPSGGGEIAHDLHDQREGAEHSFSYDTAGNQLPGDGFATQPGMAAPQAPSFIKLSRHGEAVLGKFVGYMRSLFEYQHRTFSYAVYVCYDMARLLYFDRSGTLVTEPFRWDETDSLLHRFIWKIAQLANAGRLEDLGHDPTATLAYGEAKNMFLALKDDMNLPQHVREGCKKAAEDGWPVYKLEVVHGKPSEDEWFSDMPFPPPKEFGSPSTAQSQSSIPLSESLGPLGNPLHSLEPATSLLDGLTSLPISLLVGDSWRPVIPGRTRPEHLVYQRLRFHGVNRGVGTLICGGDVGGHWAQRTCVQDLNLPADENNSKPVVYVHYRLVMEEIGIPLKDFDSFPELSAIFVDVIRAHYRAWSLARILHGDISVGNVLIVPPTKCELDAGRTPKPNRLGTWQFRSALSLRYPWKPYRHSDDIESFIHVYLYLVLRFHPVDNRSLSELVSTLFEGASLVHGIRTGGDRKLTLFRSAHGTPQIELSSNPTLQKLVQDIIAGCSRSYRTVDHDEMERRYGFAHFSGSEEPESPPALLHHAASGIVDFESDDHIPRVDEETHLQPDSPTIETAVATPRDHKDPCAVAGFLAEPGNLLDLLKRHATTQLPRSDKACDQFLARKHEDALAGKGLRNTTNNRCLGSMPTSDSMSEILLS